MSKIYVASSWRNGYQPGVVDLLRACGHLVHDFRNPMPGNHGFSWAEIDPAWNEWPVKSWIKALNHPIAVEGFKSDFEAMKWADVIVMVLPAGRSAHLEMGWGVGAGKLTAILVLEKYETPDLMPKMCDRIFTDIKSLTEWLGK